jgi:putative FmdB family regulatory protein
MPTYEYECEACGHRFELFQPIKEAVRRKCPACARLKLRRLIGAGAAVLFRGSGFYQTDYRSADYRRQAKAEKDGSAAKETPSSPAKETPSSPGKETPSSPAKEAPSSPGKQKSSTSGEGD